MKLKKPFVLAFLLSATAAFALTPTPETTEGPYYPFNSSQTLDTTWLVGADNDLTLVTGKTARASGTRFLLSGTLVDTNGAPISGATIELWQADNGGTYYYGNAAGNNINNRDANFQSYGTTTTDSSGAWSFRTIRPGLYTGRIRHFHFKVNISGRTVLTSQFMFAEDRAQFSSDGVAAPLVTAGTIDLTLLSPTTGVDSIDSASALLASKQIVVNPGSTSTGGGTTGGGMTGGGTTGPGTGGNTTPPGATTPPGGTPPGGGGPTAPASSYSLVNLSIRTTLTSASSSLTAGFVIQNGGKRMLVRAVGPSLGAYGVTGAAADPRLEIYNSTGALTTSNDNWDAALSSTFTQTGAFPLTASSRDAAVVADLPAGAGTAVLRANSAGVALLEAYDAATTSATRILNFSARGPVSDADPLIAGIVVRGTGNARLLVRAIGPGLAAFGLAGALADPRIDIYNASGVLVASNDNWDSTLAPTFAQAAAFSLASGSRDAALVATLPAGASYTIVTRGATGTSGEVLIEIYDLQ